MNGVCPDTRTGGSNDVTLLSGSSEDGVVTITYKRPLRANDRRKDIRINTSDAMNIIAAIGDLNSRNEASYHDRAWTPLESK